MSQQVFDRLLSISSASIGAPSVPVPAGVAPSLAALLRARNGFYAFESALHVFHVGAPAQELDLATWNADDTWRREYGDKLEGHLFFAEDIFGCQFSEHDGSIFSFDPEIGELELIAGSLDDWCARIMSDHSELTGWTLAHKWQAVYGPLRRGDRLVPKIPFVLGGDFVIENLASMQAVKGMKLRGHIWQQIQELPDGAQVRFVVER